MSENNQNNNEFKEKAEQFAKDAKENAEQFTKEASEKIGQFADTAKKEGAPILAAFMSFDKMISTKIIKIVYFISLVSVVFTALSLMVFGRQFFGGLITLIFGPLFVRIWAEMLIVMFNINDNLAEIKNTLKK